MQSKHLGRSQINLSRISKHQRQLLEQNYLKWKSKEITGVEFMGMLELKKNSFYKIIKEYESVRIVG
ncbi:recombinase [Bacillus cereus]|nr:recombinase [Bacillus cereus]